MKWWSRRRASSPSRVQEPILYPADSAVETEAGVFFIVKGGKCLKVYSPRVVESWKFNLLPGTLASVSLHKRAGTLGFRNGTIVQNIADSKIYLISANKRLHVQSPDVFTKYGLDENKIVRVSQEEINIHAEGEVLS